MHDHLLLADAASVPSGDVMRLAVTVGCLTQWSMISPLQWLRASAAKMKRRKVDDPDAPPKPPLAAVVVVSLSIVGIVALALWYLVQPQPLMVQGEADAKRIDVARRSQQQAKLALEEAINGYTVEERGVAKAAVAKAEAAVATLKAQVAELVVKSPIAAQVYHTSADPGEYVSPGVPLLSLVD